MMYPRERYLYDSAFRSLVDVLYMYAEQAKFTPTEIREAAMLAQIMYEERRPRRFFVEDPESNARQG